MYDNQQIRELLWNVWMTPAQWRARIYDNWREFIISLPRLAVNFQARLSTFGWSWSNCNSSNFSPKKTQLWCFFPRLTSRRMSWTLTVDPDYWYRWAMTQQSKRKSNMLKRTAICGKTAIHAQRKTKTIKLLTTSSTWMTKSRNLQSDAEEGWV